MVDIIKAIIFGIVEGITEWLPVSSTGHLILVEEFIQFEEMSEGFFEMFSVVIQFGAILAVVLIFFKRIWPFTKEAGKGFTQTGFLSYWNAEITQLWFKIIVACIPAIFLVVLGLDDYFEEKLFHYLTVAIALIVFGIAFILVENHHKGKIAKVNSITEITYKAAFVIGLFQLIAAIFPGTSRSGATIVGALLIGISRVAAAEFTFYLAIPVMAGASLLKIVKYGLAFTQLELIVLVVGMVTSFLVSILVIRFLMDYIKKHDFKVFGWYRIILGIIVIGYFAFMG